MPKSNEELLKFGTNLAKIRKEQRVTQEELAYLADIDRSYISGVERGTRNVSLLNILKISRALKISPKELFAFD